MKLAAVRDNRVLTSPSLVPSPLFLFRSTQLIRGVDFTSIRTRVPPAACFFTSTRSIDLRIAAYFWYRWTPSVSHFFSIFSFLCDIHCAVDKKDQYARVVSNPFCLLLSKENSDAHILDYFPSIFSLLRFFSFFFLFITIKCDVFLSFCATKPLHFYFFFLIFLF